MWIETDGSRQWHGNLASGTARYVLRFKATINSGVTEAATQGYVEGSTTTIGGIYMMLTDVTSVNRAGFDQVTITYATRAGFAPRSPHSIYNDSKLRQAGDEEWTLEADVEQLPAEDALAWNQNPWSGTWNVPKQDMVDQPGCLLVWRKWMDKNTARSSEWPITLPPNKQVALDAVKTYLPNLAGGSYEQSPPKIMYALGNNGIERQFLCVWINLESDGDLVCRVAKFRWNREDLNAEIFGGL